MCTVLTINFKYIHKYTETQILPWKIMYSETDDTIKFARP